MEFTHHQEDNICVVILSENLVSSNITEVEGHLRPLIDDENVKTVLLNLEKVLYIDSSGFGLLIALFQSFRKHQMTFALCQVNGKIKEFLKRMKIDRFLKIYPNERAAREELSDESTPL